MTPPPTDPNINSLASLLAEKGLDASDFIDVVQVLANIKQRDLKKAEEEEQKEAEEESKKENKIICDSEYVFPTRTDVSVYRDGRTKSGRYFIRIYDDRTKKVFTQSLKTSNRHIAIATAEKIYAENKDRMRRGVKFVSLTTKELVNMYIKERQREQSDIPHTGITRTSLDTLISHLKYWEEFIKYKKLSKRRLEDIPTEVGRDFAEWVLNQPKQFYKDRPRSRSTVNHTVACVKKMYRDIAISRKFITLAELPDFKYLKIPKDNTAKRDVLTYDEYVAIRKWIQYKYVNEKDIKPEEKIKRR